MDLEDLIAKGLAKVSCPGHDWIAYTAEATIYKCSHCGRLGAITQSGIYLIDELQQKSNTHTWRPAYIMKFASDTSTKYTHKCYQCEAVGYWCGTSFSILPSDNYTCNEMILKTVLQ